MKKHSFKPKIESLENRITPSRYAPAKMSRAEYEQMVIKQVNAEIDLLVQQESAPWGSKRDKKDRLKFMLQAMFGPKKISPVLPAVRIIRGAGSSPPRITNGSPPRVIAIRLQKAKKFKPPVVTASNTPSVVTASNTPQITAEQLTVPPRIEYDEEEDDTLPDDEKNEKNIDDVFILGLEFLKKKEEDKEDKEKEDKEKSEERIKEAEEEMKVEKPQEEVKE